MLKKFLQILQKNGLILLVAVIAAFVSAVFAFFAGVPGPVRDAMGAIEKGGETLGPVFVMAATSLVSVIAMLRYLDGNASAKAAERRKFEEAARTLAFRGRRKGNRYFWFGKPAILSTPGSANPMPTADRNKLVADIRAAALSDASNEVFREIASRISPEAVRLKAVKELTDELHNARKRLEGAIGATNRRGNLNLAIGALAGIGGLIYLGWSLAGLSAENLPTTSQLLAYTSMRIGLVVAVELLAYFFLRMYKNSAEDIKFFQNEMSNAEARETAIRLALAHADDSTIRELVMKVAATDRNFVMSKDQTTIELERSKIENSAYAEAMKLFAEIVKSRKE